MPPRDYFEKDFYKVLGVASDAPQADIAKAYRRLARKNHPDANPDDPGAESRFKEISEAYAVLSNAEKRSEYDQVQQMARSGPFGSGGFSGAPGGQSAGGFDISDLLGQMFGNQGDTGGGGFGRFRRTPSAQRGRDLETSLTLDFTDAMSGVTTTLRVTSEAACTTCGGSGAAPGTSPVTCTACGGRGVVASNQGLFSLSEPCRVCGGTGQQIQTPCPTCAGSGTQRRPRDIRARIPAGVKDGARIRLSGQGEPGPRGGPAGDLYVRVRVEPHPVFGRADDDLTVTVPLTFAEAALGTKLAVPTLEEPVTLKVPAGTQSGRRFRVRGRGAPRAGGGRGDLLVTVEVAVPHKLTRAQRQALQAFDELGDADPRAHLDEFMHSTAKA